MRIKCITQGKSSGRDFSISGFETGTSWLNVYTGWPPPKKKKKKKKKKTGTVDFSGLCSDQQVFFSSPCWIEHLFLIIITTRSSNLVENFLCYE